MENKYTSKAQRVKRMWVGLLALMLVGFGCSGFDEKAITYPDPKTPSDIVGNEADLVHRGFELVGRIVPGAAACTLMGCPEENPCCNQCSGSLSMVDEDAADDAPSVELRPYVNIEEAFECSGDECEMTCEPMENGAVYILQGSWQQDEEGDYYYQTFHYSRM